MYVLCFKLLKKEINNILQKKLNRLQKKNVKLENNYRIYYSFYLILYLWEKSIYLNNVQ